MILAELTHTKSGCIMEQELSSLTVNFPPQPETLVIIDVALLERVNTLSMQAAQLAVISSDVENEAGGALLKVVTQLEKEVEESATAANKPFHDVQKAITKEKQKVTTPLASIKAALKFSLSTFIVKRDRERAEIEAAAARQRAAEQAELDKINAARAAEAAANNVPAPAPIVAPVSEAIIAKPAVAKADAIKTVRKMVVHIVDAGAVPRAYCIPDKAMIEAAWKRGEITPEFHPFFRVEEVVSVMAK